MVIVVVILAIIAAIAIPRMTRGTESSAEAALAQNLTVLQRAAEFYAAEHGQYPSGAAVVQQLTGYTDLAGQVSPTNTRTGPYLYGPYLRSVPPMPVGPNKGATGVGTAAGPGVAWVYDPARGAFTANTAGASDGTAESSETSESSTSSGGTTDGLIDGTTDLIDSTLP